MTTKTFQRCFAAYQAVNSRQPVDPPTFTGTVSPDGWPR
jgi:hypothetical protein